MGVSGAYTQLSGDDIPDPSILGPYTSQAYIAACVGYRISPGLAAGFSVKPMFSHEWVCDPGNSAFRGVAFSVACDGGLQYQPSRCFGLGAAFTNLGPPLVYGDSGRARLPTTIRIGWELNPQIRGPFELRLASDLWRNLANPLPRDTVNPVLAALDMIGKGIGVELRIARLASLHFGYVEDMDFGTGGVFVRHDYPFGWSARWEETLVRFLFKRPPEYRKLEGFGLTWGAGLDTKGLPSTSAMTRGSSFAKGHGTVVTGCRLRRGSE